MTILQLAAFKIQATIAQSFYVANSGVIPNYQLYGKQDYLQRFAWFTQSTTFFPVGESGTYWTEIYLGDSQEISPEIDFAISLPFINSVSTEIDVGGSDYGEITTVTGISLGIYKLIYQKRYLTQAEIDQLPAELPPEDPDPIFGASMGPKQCSLMFIPTSTRPEPEILKPLRGKKSNIPLFLHESDRPR